MKNLYLFLLVHFIFAVALLARVSSITGRTKGKIIFTFGVVQQTEQPQQYSGIIIRAVMPNLFRHPQ